ncbi:protein-L-isoaspartate(D-aspartate) O-methyltransferase [Spongiactinospora gelatinilytica]|uniref:Protein-L-isoaspartate O-methyltransferase n=1 Tax=Spongiactinospora gelatinilytica TaxID=2666298 RepID=A0A2W2GVC1_9ACTN|nr:methyltransferase domain-containing protein [Spongiactinospora gelatinilytica]PZG41218.1 protein-L-isoaspartate(D-aspartate) O-methyltransferase [Spongiactinospora gelatinilytica]
MANVAARIEHLIDEVAAIDDLSEPVRAALRAVPRHLFIPPLALAAHSDKAPWVINRDTDPKRWWGAVYSDNSIVIQLDDGARPIESVIGEDGAPHLKTESGHIDYSSSNSAPSTVTDFLQLLDPEPGHRVLEIGTGTGWTSALLSHLAGEHNVTSIEVDAAVAEQAAKNLSDAGIQPHLIVGDGAAGHPDRAPYDRMHVTCGIRTVPYAWIEQTRPGGVIVAPWCPNFGTNHALRLIVLPDGTAHGRFPGFASYMMLRSQRPAGADDGTEHRFRTRIDPRTIAYAPPGADLAIAAMTGLRSDTKRLRGGGFRLWVLDPARAGQWAAVTWQPEADDYEIYQVGDRPLWDEVTTAYFRWVVWGEPGRDRFGMTVTPDGQQVWLDTPQQVIG